MPRTSETPAKSAVAIEASGGGWCVDSQLWPIAPIGSVARTFAAMVPQHVELVLFEQSLGKGEGLHRQIHGVHDCNHRVEPGDVRQALAVLVAEVEGGGDWQRLGNAGSLD